MPYAKLKIACYSRIKAKHIRIIFFPGEKKTSYNNIFAYRIKFSAVQKFTKNLSQNSLIQFYWYSPLLKIIEFSYLFFSHTFYPKHSFLSLHLSQPTSPIPHTYFPSVSLQKRAFFPWISTEHGIAVRSGTNPHNNWARQCSRRKKSQEQANESKTPPTPTLRNCTITWTPSKLRCCYNKTLNIASFINNRLPSLRTVNNNIWVQVNS